MDIKIRGTITENEKHLHNLFYNFIKCKIKRYELLLESPEYQKIVNKDHDRGFKEIYDELKQKEDILFNKKLEMEIAHNENIVELEKIKKKAEISALKYEHYINKINKKVSFEEAIEYKSRLLSKL
ncbi:MAG: hypothetical protein IPH89_12600 [Bacteroidetes bacterium]|nr:hypothetical protein [Bacteroidota bacterium]